VATLALRLEREGQQHNNEEGCRTHGAIFYIAMAFLVQSQKLQKVSKNRSNFFLLERGDGLVAVVCIWHCPVNIRTDQSIDRCRVKPKPIFVVSSPATLVESTWRAGWHTTYCTLSAPLCFPGVVVVQGQQQTAARNQLDREATARPAIGPGPDAVLRSLHKCQSFVITPWRYLWCRLAVVAVSRTRTRCETRTSSAGPSVYTDASPDVVVFVPRKEPTGYLFTCPRVSSTAGTYGPDRGRKQKEPGSTMRWEGRIEPYQTSTYPSEWEKGEIACVRLSDAVPETASIDVASSTSIMPSTTLDALACFHPATTAGTFSTILDLVDVRRRSRRCFRATSDRAIIVVNDEARAAPVVTLLALLFFGLFQVPDCQVNVSSSRDGDVSCGAYPNHTRATTENPVRCCCRGHFRNW